MIFLATFLLGLGSGLVAVAIDDGLFSSAMTVEPGWARFLFAVIGTFLGVAGLRGWFKVLTGVKPDPQALHDEAKLKRLKLVGIAYVGIGLFLGAVAVGALGDSVGPDASWVTALLIVAGLWMILMGLVFRWDPKPALKMQGLRAGQGIDGRARILEVRDTGWTVNDAPRVDLDLEITVGTNAPYPANFKGTVPRLSVGRLVPGDTVPVTVDRNDPQTFLIQWGKP